MNPEALGGLTGLGTQPELSSFRSTQLLYLR